MRKVKEIYFRYMLGYWLQKRRKGIFSVRIEDKIKLYHERCLKIMEGK